MPILVSGAGFAITESNDAKVMFQYRAQWADLLAMTVPPCLEDADAGRSWRLWASVDTMRLG